ncbi:uncharacterized protein LOC135391555 isoform X1 [Ornithodoros turicata]|uniref:uncharacterized protein LOC135391555 isoform X1 n=1 Tax=Ornithodoros turicata TaxID=34597 RepID=UPI0031387496
MEPRVMLTDDKSRKRLQLIRTYQGHHVYFQCPVKLENGNEVRLPWHTKYGVAVVTVLTATADSPNFKIRFKHRDIKDIVFQVELTVNHVTKAYIYGAIRGTGPSVTMKTGDHILVEYHVKPGEQFMVYVNDTYVANYGSDIQELTDFHFEEAGNISMTEFHHVVMPSTTVERIYQERTKNRRQPWPPGAIYAGSVARLNGTADKEDLVFKYTQEGNTKDLSIGRATKGASLDIVVRFFSKTAMIFVSTQSSPHTYNHQATIYWGVMEIDGLKMMDFSVDTGNMSCPLPLVTKVP